RQQYVGEHNRHLIPPTFVVPVLPTALTSFLKLADDPNATSVELGKIVERDTGLTCDLLRLANASSTGIRQKVATAQRAIAMLGVRRCKMLLISSATERALKPKINNGFDYLRFSHTNLQRSFFAQQVSKALGQDTDLAFAAAILADCILPLVLCETSTM